MDLVQPYLTKSEEQPTNPVTKGASLTAKWTGRGIRGRPWTNVQALALENTAEAMAKLVELLNCDNPCVKFGAARMVLERGHGKVPLIYKGESTKSEPRQQALKVQITRFKEEKTSGDATRDNKLPVVPGRRKRSRDTGHGAGA
ncbi:MAG TPA: hypothetical protein VGT99_06875 [Gammaproteobacteria bacterium]|nr:hypothetical protein [Gammaproteobacteria bacterium]